MEEDKHPLIKIWYPNPLVEPNECQVRTFQMMDTATMLFFFFFWRGICCLEKYVFGTTRHDTQRGGWKLTSSLRRSRQSTEIAKHIYQERAKLKEKELYHVGASHLPALSLGEKKIINNNVRFKFLWLMHRTEVTEPVPPLQQGYAHLRCHLR